MLKTIKPGSGLPEKGSVLPTGPSKPAMMDAVKQLLDLINDKPLDKDLENYLNQVYGPQSAGYAELLRLLRTGGKEGWAFYAEITGPEYRRGRIAAPSAETYGLSVESGLLTNVQGNFHRHPYGEINMIGPVDPTGQFCGHGAGWKVFPPNSQHYPTVTGGAVTMLFFLPKGEIEYKSPSTA